MLLEDLKDYLGFAVAGNFANHLGEAGEADEFAVNYLIKANIDPKPMADFMFRLCTMGGDLPNYMSWMNTHPESENRAQSILDQIKDQDIIPEPVLNEEEWETLQSIHEEEW